MFAGVVLLRKFSKKISSVTFSSSTSNGRQTPSDSNASAWVVSQGSNNNDTLSFRSRASCGRIEGCNETGSECIDTPSAVRDDSKRESDCGGF